MSTQGENNGQATPKKNTINSEQAQPLEESPRENSTENAEINLSFEDHQNDGETKEEQIEQDQKEKRDKISQETKKTEDKKGNEQNVDSKDGNSNQNEQSKNNIQKQENQKPQQDQNQSKSSQKQIPQGNQSQPQGKSTIEDKSKSQREDDEKQILFNQLLGEMLDVHKTSQAVYQAIDQNKKGFIQQEDLAKELVDSFGIDDEEKQAEIFKQLSKGAKQVSRQEFEGIFKKIEEERKQLEEEEQEHEKEEQQQEKVGQTPEKVENKQPNSSQQQKDISQKSQNQQKTSEQSKQSQQQSQKPSKEEKQIKQPQQQQQQRQLPQSPFKNQQERDEMINIFEGEVDLEKANNTQHFTEDSKYAPVIRKLREQPNFDDFVRQYNSLQFPRNNGDPIQISPNASYQQPYNQQQQLQYNPFSKVSAEHQNKLAHRFELFANTAAPPVASSSSSSQIGFIQVSPVRKNKTANLNVSPSQGLFDSFEKNTKDWRSDKNLEFVPKKGSLLIQDSFIGSQKQPKYGRFLSPQQNRNIQSQPQGNLNSFGKDSFASNNNQTLGGNRRSSNGFLINNKGKNFQTNSLLLPLKDFNDESKNNLWNSQLSNNQSRQFGVHRNYQNMNMLAGDLASPKLSQSSYFQSPRQEQNSLFQSRDDNQYQEQQLTPNHKRLNRLKRQVGIGLDSLQAIHKNDFIVQQRLPSPEQGQQTRQMKESFKQYLSSQLGMTTSPQQQQQQQVFQTRGTSGQNQQYAQEDIFGDIMQKIQGGRAPLNATQDRSRKAVPNMDSLGGNLRNGSPYGNSVSPRGVHGQMERVKKIQAALRAPLKKKLKFDGISIVSPGKQERGTSKTQKRQSKEEYQGEKKKNTKIDWFETNTSKIARNK